MDDEYDELDFGDQDGPSLFDAPDEPPARRSPEPAAVTPEPVSAVPEPVVSTSEPVVSPPEPAVSTPEPVPSTPEPVPSTPEPAEGSSSAAPARPDVPEAPLALYRRYRPDTFGDVIGQEHVTEPLKRALTNNRVNHAYLFSGPRGCGKTTSARILARALNCESGPTPEPCGHCQSCRDLARGGSGSIDVIEIDAASHGGVDDARDLRERAFFAPVHSRYKIYIVDEAHMVTTAGFNALLKLVEEPPPHVKFIFATTEPEKVIGTIRSRTHHYPFRLVPPRVLGDYLRHLCDAEGVPIEQSVLPLVVRAGAGSVRDSLSVLDQLLGGAGVNGVTYDQSVALLGFTPDALLDEIVDAFAAGDGAGVFATIDKVIEVGQDPRRFAEDLLRRLRDLVIVASVPDAASSGLIDVASDQAERLAVQAAGIGAGELTRAAEVMAEGLVAMRGTTAPRLHLELMCARVLLPGADVDGRGVHARLDRLERRLGMPEGASAGGAATATPAPVVAAPVSVVKPTATPAPEPPAPVRAEEPARKRTWDEPPPEDDWTPPVDRDQAAPAQAAQTRPALRVVRDPEPVAPAQPAPPVAAPVASAPAPEPVAPPAAGGGPAATDVRRLWPDVLEEVKRRRRFTWMTISQHAQVAEVSDGTLVLSFANPGARDSFLKGGSDDVLRDALVEVMGADLRISALLESEMKGGRPAPAAPVPVEDDSPDSPASPDVPEAEPTDTVPAADEWRAEPEAPVVSTGRSALLAQARAQAAEVAEPSVVIDVGDRDDPDVADTDAESLLRDMLHAEVIDD